ncbi:MAG: CocE/NonD family hydrolase [Acidobacteriota bacterium]|nr:CocE/NonD family hydrolase [Acidobacteriota bacterium]
MVLRFLLFSFLFVGMMLPAPAQNKLSSFARYSGYSQPKYTRWFRFSEYITVSDGTRLAADMYRPAENGVTIEEPLPVIWSHKRFHRSNFKNGTTSTDADTRLWIRDMVQHGYVVVTVDGRGSGASLGSRPVPFLETDPQDVYDVTEWIIAQSWCNGKVGMYGKAYDGVAALMGLSKQPKLAAIMAEKTLFDLYDFAWGGGIYVHDYLKKLGDICRQLDLKYPAPATDADSGGKLLRQARRDHRDNGNIDDMLSKMPFRDSVDNKTGRKLYLTDSPSTYARAASDARIPVFLWAGWQDLFVAGTFQWYLNLEGPKRLIAGPWTYQDRNDRLMSTELRRWFDYWLKDIPNGIADEAPIHYYLTNAATRNKWRHVDQWPRPGTRDRDFFFNAGPSSTLSSVNDGRLGNTADAAGADKYTVNYLTSSGKPSRWSNGYGEGGHKFKYRDRRSAGELALSYTGEPLEADLEIAGYPSVTLHLAVDADDVDLFVYLEEVDADGKSNYITEGFQRASLRAAAAPPFKTGGAPWLRAHTADQQKLIPGQKVEVTVSMLPIAHYFQKGNRVRVTITGADGDNRLTPRRRNAPEITLHYGGETPSRLTLPVIPAE